MPARDEMLMQMLVIMTASGTGRSDFFFVFVLSLMFRKE